MPSIEQAAYPVAAARTVRLVPASEGGGDMSVTQDVTSSKDNIKSKIDQAALEPGREGTLTKRMEGLSSRMPSDLWLVAAGLSIATSFGLRVMGRVNDANFVGHWAPTFLMIGVYNKIVKVLGSERRTAGIGGARATSGYSSDLLS
jgi:hypothetical protein